MRFVPIANVAQRGVNQMRQPREQVAAVMASTPAMEEDIGVRSGAAPGAGVFKTNLYTGEQAAAADKAYMEALTRTLPKYVNAYRAYVAEQKKKTGSGGGGGGTGIPTGVVPGFSPAAALPPVEQYLPNVPDVAGSRTRDLYRGLSQALMSQRRSPGRVASRRAGAAVE